MSFTERKIAYPLFLGILFLAAFAIPVLFFLNMKASRSDTEELDDSGDMHVTVAVPDANNYIKVASANELNPDSSSDFIFWIWFRLRKLPEEGEPVIFVAKLDAKVRANPGYTFGVTREGDRILPIVYWRDHSGQGSSHSFANMSVLPRDWTLLVLSFTDGKYLSLNGYSMTATATGKKQDESATPQLLGAYDIAPPVIPATDAPLIVGALQNGRFRGHIGPFGILKGEKLAKKLPDIIKNIISSPFANPLAEGGETLSLLVVDEEQDRSQFSHEVMNRSARMRRRKKENGHDEE